MKAMLLAGAALAALAVSAQAADPVVISAVNPSLTTDILSTGLTEKAVAEGAFKLENPSEYLGYYGYGTDGPLMPKKGDKSTKDQKVEATKTEPDKNTYLVLEGATGPAKGVKYGTHFIFQGHEGGPKDKDGVAHGGLTRINLDAPVAHRVTLMAVK